MRKNVRISVSMPKDLLTELDKWLETRKTRFSNRSEVFREGVWKVMHDAAWDGRPRGDE